MKKAVLVMMLLLFLVGCSHLPTTYSYPNRSTEIVSIKLLLNQNNLGVGTDESNMVLIRELNADEITAFMNEIYELPTKPVGTPPPWGYGRYLAKVKYTNGDIEIFGSLNIEFIPSGNNPTGIGDYHFTGDGFETLFLQYRDSTDPSSIE